MLEKLDEVRENIFRYLEARIELFTLETRGKVEEGVIRAIHGVILGFLATITLIFLLSLLAAFLNEVFESRYMGFLIVAAFFLVLTIIWVVAKDSFLNMIRKMAYNSLKASKEKKAEEKSEAVQELMNQTRDSMTGSGPYLARE
ncbi:phage holin family protein [Rudanella paleaurantiibacter]|uniref:Phage holin family protein n=1 Tax=Rudanella paleaurantiibacter TaxID=2614655 RepID=A0A7J5TWM4_9BACT|nr:phage holin family protein [Rudanella paleaurantiibacter]KAB7729032.1 phage holin family protein [Rudanella paleaurantiibacter]